MSKHGYRLDNPARIIFHERVERCGKVFVSGLCAHVDNSLNEMHTCALLFHHPDPTEHECSCGKGWTDAQGRTTES